MRLPLVWGFGVLWAPFPREDWNDRPVAADNDDVESRCARLVRGGAEKFAPGRLRDRFSGSQRAMSASIDHARAPLTISATAAPSARRWYSTPSPSCVPNQFIKKPCFL